MRVPFGQSSNLPWCIEVWHVGHTSSYNMVVHRRVSCYCSAVNDCAWSASKALGPWHTNQTEKMGKATGHPLKSTRNSKETPQIASCNRRTLNDIMRVLDDVKENMQLRHLPIKASILRSSRITPIRFWLFAGGVLWQSWPPLTAAVSDNQSQWNYFAPQEIINGYQSTSSEITFPLDHASGAIVHPGCLGRRRIGELSLISAAANVAGSLEFFVPQTALVFLSH